MPKYLSLPAIRTCLGRLKGCCNPLIVDFLILKRDGLRTGKPVVINTKSTQASAQRLMGVFENDGTPPDTDHVFFNPFAADWRHEGYPRSGTYSTLDRSKTLARIVTVDRPGLGMRLTVTDDYVAAVERGLRRSKAKALEIPLQALAVWALRYDEFEEGDTVAKLTRSFLAEYHLNTEERDAFFDVGATAPADVFSDEPLDRDALVAVLRELAPRDDVPTGGVDEPETVTEDLPEDLLEFVRQDLLLPESLLRQLVTLLRAGKHIILTGPPGTGKSTLAARLAEVSEKFAGQFAFPASSGHLFTTATADWSTFDTLGGYVPMQSGPGLDFQEGLFLQAIRENKWLVIDELNRADVDKAFGQLFTVLSGHAVVTNFRKSGANVTIAFDRNVVPSGFKAEEAEYAVGRDWRIIATMNSFDRNMLFQLSAAFVRRFAVVHVGIPPAEQLVSWFQARELAPDEVALVAALVSILEPIRPLGPALWSDVIDYMEVRSKHSFGAAAGAAQGSSFTEALIAYILPQLDGLDRESLNSIEGQISELLTLEEDKRQLQQSFREMF